ncbi:hypothetical protein LTR16_006662, partial [Cryomyces antarcticus]
MPSTDEITIAMTVTVAARVVARSMSRLVDMAEEFVVAEFQGWSNQKMTTVRLSTT